MRMGYARFEAILEDLKRSLNLGTATITAASLTATTDLIGNGNFKVDATGHKTGVEGVTHSAAITASSGTTWASGAMAIPAHAIITDIGVVVTTQLTTTGNATFGFKSGDDAGEADIAAAVADNLKGGSTSSVAVGKGLSTVATTTAALGGAAVTVLAANAAYSASARNIHSTITISANAISAGTVRFYVKYIHVEGGT